MESIFVVLYVDLFVAEYKEQLYLISIFFRQNEKVHVYIASL